MGAGFMGGMSIWHWLLIPGYLLFTVLPVYIGIVNGRGKPPLSRLTYIQLVCAAVLLLIGIQIVGRLAQDMRVSLGMSLVHVLLIYEMTRQLVRRLTDAGYNPSLAWLCILPIINLIMYLAGCVLPRKVEQQVEPDLIDRDTNGRSGG